MEDMRATRAGTVEELSLAAVIGQLELDGPANSAEPKWPPTTRLRYDRCKEGNVRVTLRR